MTATYFASVTRISDLRTRAFDVVRLPRKRWASGDYVVGKITGSPGRINNVEVATGRTINAMTGNFVVGAFGTRSATLEAVGSWADIRDGRMHGMTSAGLFGAITSAAATLPQVVDLEYAGHAIRDGQKVTMPDFAIGAATGRYDVPTVLLVGTSMSAGKTTTGRLVVHELEKTGKRVIGAKLTGAGRYRDVLSFRDAGAAEVFDFVDAGLPSTVVPEAEFRAAIAPLLRHIASLEPDVVVVEAGASPLEPYNGTAAIDELGGSVRCTILCASDPYAVVGVEKAFGLRPDLIAGPAASTSAAIDLVRKLCGVEAINVMHPDCLPPLHAVLQQTLGL